MLDKNITKNNPENNTLIIKVNRRKHKDNKIQQNFPGNDPKKPNIKSLVGGVIVYQDHEKIRPDLESSSKNL